MRAPDFVADNQMRFEDGQLPPAVTATPRAWGGPAGLSPASTRRAASASPRPPRPLRHRSRFRRGLTPRAGRGDPPRGAPGHAGKRLQVAQALRSVLEDPFQLAADERF